MQPSRRSGAPLSNRELVLAKVLGWVIPAVLLVWAAFILDAVVVNVLGGPATGAVLPWTWGR